MPEPGDLVGLHGLRPPPDGLAEAAGALGVGLLLAAGIVALARLLSTRRSRRAEARARLAAARSLPAEERVVALAHVLREAGARRLPPGVAALLGPALYRPGPPPDTAPLERAARRAVARMQE